MLDLLSDFVTELRKAGLPVSLTEHLDAAEAVHHIPLEDREGLKYTLAATLVKSASHWHVFETAFEVFFAVRYGHSAAGEADAEGNELGENAEGSEPGVNGQRGQRQGLGRRRRNDGRRAGGDAVQVSSLVRPWPHECRRQGGR